MTKIHIPTWLLHTSHLSIDERGMVMLLALHYSEHGEIPPSNAELARLARSTPAQWRKHADVVLRAWDRLRPKLFKGGRS